MDSRFYAHLDGGRYYKVLEDLSQYRTGTRVRLSEDDIARLEGFDPVDWELVNGVIQPKSGAQRMQAGKPALATIKSKWPIWIGLGLLAASAASLAAYFVF